MVSRPEPQELHTSLDQPDLYLLTAHTVQVDPDRYLPAGHRQCPEDVREVAPLGVLPPGRRRDGGGFVLI